MAKIDDGLMPIMLRLKMATENMRPLYRVFGNILVESTQKTIEVSGRPKPFAPLALATLFGRAGARFVAGKILGGSKVFKKGALEKGVFSAKSLKKRAAAVMSAAKPLFDQGVYLKSFASDTTDRSVIWGSAAKQGALLNFGGWAGRGHAVFVPARPHISEDQPFDEDYQAMEKATLDHLGVND